METTFGVVMPLEPKWHQIAALAVAQKFLASVFTEIKFWTSPNQDVPTDTIREWSEQNLYPIDLGPNWYSKREGNLGSAIDVVVADLEIPPSPALDELRRMAARNNKDGYLRNQPGSIVRLLREMYKLGWSETEVVEAVMPTVDAFTVVFGLPKNEGESEVMFRLIADERLRQSVGPFTIARYARDMIRLGILEEEIVQRLETLLDGWHKDRFHQNRGIGKVNQHINYKVDVRFNLDNDEIGVVITTDDPEVARGIMYEYPLAVIRRFSGHTTIKVRGRAKRIFNLAMALTEREPGLWFFDTRFPYTINREPSQATSLTGEELVALVREHVVW